MPPEAHLRDRCGVAALQFHLFLPQMRLTMPQLVERAQTAERAGFQGIAGMDHLVPPLAETQPMYEAMVTNTWLAAHTSTLHVASLVLCDAFRHPAVVAREAVSIDHASGGRFELGIGWGSVVSEFETFGIGSTAAPDRVGRLAESLEIIEALWAGETVDHDGEHFTLHDARQAPLPLDRIPIVIGGTGGRTPPLVAKHPDWGDNHTRILPGLHRLDGPRAPARGAPAAVPGDPADGH